MQDIVREMLISELIHLPPPDFYWYNITQIPLLYTVYIFYPGNSQQTSEKITVELYIQP